MKEILVFAGTTEGRKLAEHLLNAGKRVHICVATEYGEEVLWKHEHLIVHQGRLDVSGMEELLISHDWEMIVDATHPYAVEVSKNIKTACENTYNECIRLLRTDQQKIDDSHVSYVNTLDDAAQLLNNTEGNILLTTGSKELPKYIERIEDISRIYARILADGTMVEKCKEMGLLGKQIICMQGPFSAELNAAMLKQVDAKYLVTKDTGVTGGFPEKIQGAKIAGAKVIVIRRPVEETGYSLDQILERLSLPALKSKAKVTLLGIGMGNLKDLTLTGKEACENADVILGAARMTEALSCFGKESLPIYQPEEVVEYIRNHPDKKRIVVAFSGDIGFYSGTKKLLKALEELKVDVELICGISSVVYFASKLQTSWEDMKLISVHGRIQNLIAAVKSHEKVFTLAGYKESIQAICRDLVEHGLVHVKVSVGCQLSYSEESITIGTPEELCSFEKDGLCVVVIENPKAKEHIITHGLPDNVFERGNAPMTKEEIRSISISKLALTKQSIVYDIGAGTGSIGIECALQATDGTVYAIEKKADALELLAKNQQRCGVTNLKIVAGEAPLAMDELPAPTHTFIGGSSGNMKEIVNLLLEKNPSVRIVINCIALETVAEVMNLLKVIQFEFQDIVQVSVGKSKTLGNYHMMMGQNPVYIITLQGKMDEIA